VREGGGELDGMITICGGLNSPLFCCESGDVRITGDDVDDGREVGSGDAGSGRDGVEGGEESAGEWG
jgi:hypothetical protein